MTKKIIALICFLLVMIVPMFAQEQEPSDDDYIGVVSYTKGEQIFSLNAGAIFPLFNLAPFSDASLTLSETLSSVSPGVAGSIKWGTFISDNFFLGAELCGMFATTYNQTLTMVPISFTAGYYFIKYPFEFPIYINAGFSLNTWDEYFRVTGSIKPGAGAYWNFNGDWAFGLNLDYWFLPELYFSDTLADQSRIANFLQLSLSAVYHF